MPRSFRIARIAAPSASSAGSSACFGDAIGISEWSAYDDVYTTDDLRHEVPIFRVDEFFEIPIPPALREIASDEEGRYYGVVDLVGNRPLWLVHALTHDVTAAARWRRLLFSRMEDALRALTSPGWEERHLYVLAPQYLTGMNTITLLSCTSVEQCMEPDNNNICWRVKTERGMLLDSSFATSSGRERHPRVVWHQAT